MTFHTIQDVGGEVVKDEARYVVKDNTQLKNLVLSSTRLNPNHMTRGHVHAGQEEIYFFIEGTGEIQLNNIEIDVSPGTVVLIEDGMFHKVTAGEDGCYFVTVFDGKRNNKYENTKYD